MFKFWVLEHTLKKEPLTLYQGQNKHMANVNLFLNQWLSALTAQWNYLAWNV